MTHDALAMLPKIHGPIPEEPYRTHIRQFLLKLYQDRYALSTIATYGWHLNKLGVWLGEKGIFDPEQVDSLVVIEWGSRSRTIYSPQTHKQCAVVTKSYFKFLFEMKYCSEQVAITVDKLLAIPKVDITLQRTFNEEELTLLLSTCKDASIRGIRDYAIIALLLDTGLRAGELCQIKVSDIDFLNRTIPIIGKGGGHEQVYFSQKCQDALQNWIEVRSTIEIKSEKLFIAIGGLTPGKEITTRGLRSIVQKIGRKANVENVHPHAFRRSFATLRIKTKGQSTRGVQRLGRWQNLQTFERYTQALMVDDEFARREANNYSLLADVM